MREFKIDAMDAIQVEKYENALKSVKGAAIKGDTVSQKVRAQCKVVRKFFDECFGEGEGEERFGDSWNFKEHFDAMADVIEQTNKTLEDANREMAERMQKYTANRAQRRAKK